MCDLYPNAQSTCNSLRMLFPGLGESLFVCYNTLKRDNDYRPPSAFGVGDTGSTIALIGLATGT